MTEPYTATATSVCGSLATDRSSGAPLSVFDAGGVGGTTATLGVSSPLACASCATSTGASSMGGAFDGASLVSNEDDGGNNVGEAGSGGREGAGEVGESGEVGSGGRAESESESSEGLSAFVGEVGGSSAGSAAQSGVAGSTLRIGASGKSHGRGTRAVGISLCNRKRLVNDRDVEENEYVVRDFE